MSEKIFVEIDQDTKELKGFYSTRFNNNIPNEVVEITKTMRDKIIDCNKRFKVIDLEQPITLDNLEEIVKEAYKRPISETEQLRADVDYLAIMTGVEL